MFYFAATLLVVIFYIVVIWNGLTNPNPYHSGAVPSPDDEIYQIYANTVSPEYAAEHLQKRIDKANAWRRAHGYPIWTEGDDERHRFYQPKKIQPSWYQRAS